MPKKLSAEEGVADPVRARLQAQEPQSRLGALAGRAAARSTPTTSEPTPSAPPPAPRKVEARPRAEPAASEQRVKPKPSPVVTMVPTPPPVMGADDEPEAQTVGKKARFTPTEAAENEDIVRLVGRLTGSKPSESAVTRVLWTLLRESEAELKHEGRKGLVLRRPPNGSSIEMATYERELGRFLIGALKNLEF